MERGSLERQRMELGSLETQGGTGFPGDTGFTGDTRVPGEKVNRDRWRHRGVQGPLETKKKK